MRKLLLVVVLLGALLGCSGSPGASSPDADYLRCIDESVMPIMEKVELDMDMIDEARKPLDISGLLAPYGIWVDDTMEAKIAVLACTEPTDPLLKKARSDLLAGLDEYLSAGELATRSFRDMDMVSANLWVDKWNEGTRLIRSSRESLEEYKRK